MKYLLKILSVLIVWGSLLGASAFAQTSEKTLTERIQFLEDQYAIEQLVVVKYGDALDAFNAEAYADLFTDDGVLNLVGNLFVGREGILGMFANPASMGPPPKPGEEPVAFEMPESDPDRIVMQHVITNTSFEIEGNTAEGRSYYQEVGTLDGKAHIFNSGHYDDVLRKENGTWKFLRRNIMQDNPPASSFE